MPGPPHSPASASPSLLLLWMGVAFIALMLALITAPIDIALQYFLYKTIRNITSKYINVFKDITNILHFTRI